MLVVVALGGNALLRRGEPVTADLQRSNARAAAQALAPIAAAHQLVIGHGNGPQVGLLALKGAAYAKVETYPLDALGAQTEGMIGYMIEQELGNLLPAERSIATLQTMVEVDPDDPAFRNPTKFIGPLYLRDEAERLASVKGWVFKPEGDKWRRVVASPQPKRIFETRPITWLLERNVVVIASGGGGIPTTCDKSNPGTFVGAECVVDKDLALELLARELNADVFVMLTGTDAVCVDFGAPAQRAIRRASPDALATFRFPSGTMGAKVEAACRFATATGRKAAIGAPADLEKILDGRAGTTISVAEEGVIFANDPAPASRAAVGT